MSNIKGFKVFNPDWTCRDYQYKVGETFKHNGDIKLDGCGFHFCKTASGCFKYCNFDRKNKVAEVIATGLVEGDGYKYVTDELIVVREISWQDLLTIVNYGENCTGFANIGNCNTGDKNDGDWNTGNYNLGDWNTGLWNIGSYNVGDKNVGDWNVGDYNLGNWNVGDCNTCDFSTGVFCADEEKIKIFDKPSDLTYRDWVNSKAKDIINWNMETTVWIYEENMSDEEKEQHPTYKTMGGYLRVFNYKEAWSNLWNRLTYSEKQEIKNIPNFDSEKFEKITGIKVEE